METVHAHAHVDYFGFMLYRQSPRLYGIKKCGCQYVL